MWKQKNNRKVDAFSKSWLFSYSDYSYINVLSFYLSQVFTCLFFVVNNSQWKIGSDLSLYWQADTYKAHTSVFFQRKYISLKKKAKHLRSTATKEIKYQRPMKRFVPHCFDAGKKKHYLIFCVQSRPTARQRWRCRQSLQYLMAVHIRNLRALEKNNTDDLPIKTRHFTAFIITVCCRPPPAFKTKKRKRTWSTKWTVDQQGENHIICKQSCNPTSKIRLSQTECKTLLYTAEYLTRRAK